MPKKDYEVRGDRVYLLKTGQKVGRKNKEGKWEGPHPWEDNATIICKTPAQLRAAQREECRNCI